MKKLLLLPFLILNFSFGFYYVNSYTEIPRYNQGSIMLDDLLLQGSDGLLWYSLNGFRNIKSDYNEYYAYSKIPNSSTNFVAFTISEYATELFWISKPSHDYETPDHFYTGFEYNNLTTPNFIYKFISYSTFPNPSYSIQNLYKFEYETYQNTKKVGCFLSRGEYLNTDTGSCDTNCDLIPNLTFRSDCMCKKQGLGDLLSVNEVMFITNNADPNDFKFSDYCIEHSDEPACYQDPNEYMGCEITCQNGKISDLPYSYCYTDDRIKQDNNTSNCYGCNLLDNDDNNNNNNNDDNSTGGGSSSGNLGGGGGPESDYCKDHPEICYPDNNNSGGNTGGGGGNGGGSTGGNTGGGGGSTGGGNNGGNNNNDNDPNGHETTPSGGDNPPSDDTSDDDGECKGENCTPNDITSDYKKMLDDAQGKFDGAYSDTKNQIDGLIDTAKSAINDIKNGGFIQHGKMQITTCPIKSEVINFGFFSYRFEYDLCEWLTKLYNVFYFLTLVTCLFFGLKWILSHIFNIGGSE